MLSALELVGFKSFADKTRFQFSHGITVIVGPNGSGKSNIVDAVKWVLGEQSVKSLRGREMADVIFNGSGARRGLNSAEITLTLDNSSGRLPVDAPEMHITRRVFRGGEGEYLLNRQPCRLRDIRDLLAGTGMGTDAYSVIEQGKVDVLLQSSPRDRRAIFEEAAGISRFKAKKVEALRRLERVDQNLLRLSDIVDEVENRLRSVRLQAGKARRYKQYSDRLQELRTQVGRVDWRRLSDRLADLESELQTVTDERNTGAAEADALDARLLECDAQIGELTEAIRIAESRFAAHREQIAAAESSIAHQRVRGRDLDEEIARFRRQLVSLNARAGDLEQQTAETLRAVEASELEQGQIAGRLAQSQRELDEVTGRLDRARAENQQCRQAMLDHLRADAALNNEIGALETQAASAAAARHRAAEQMAELDNQAAALGIQGDELGRRCQSLLEQVNQREERLAAARTDLATQQQQSAAVQAGLAELRQRHAGVAERAAVLSELEKRQEGISAGAKEALAQARGSNPGSLDQVCGLVADLFQVSLETAPLVEVVLGPAAQHLVAVRTRELINFLQSPACRFSSRVGFVWLDQPASPGEAGPSLDGWPGVIGRADRFVQTEPRFAPLAERLLGRTWVVETLAHALRLAESSAGRAGFVSLAGEFLAPDGTLLVGPRQAAAGLISRRSQLRAFQAQAGQLDDEIRKTQATADGLRQQIARQEQQLARLSTEHRQAADDLAQSRFRLAAVQQDQGRLAGRHAELETEIRTAETQHHQVSGSLAGVRGKKQQAEAGAASLESQAAALARQIDELEEQQVRLGRQTTEIKVELGKSEERVRNLRARLRQFEENQQERRRAVAEGGDRLAEALQRSGEASRSILQAEAQIANLYLHKEASAAETGRLIDQRSGRQQCRAGLQGESQQLRGHVRKLEERMHAKELEANQTRLERNTLVDRLRDDYGIDLEQAQPEDAPQQERDAAEKEIDDLRRKINALGNVNLEALEELEQLEARHRLLSDQHKDLTSAKESLEKIIEKINSDSRRLFGETMEVVKGHFQTLFRDLFGGGRADIVMQEGVDILESDIEIVARPPGKEPRSISLLSGGEKTLTCVALLLAIFRSRPSPFCVLDEVDAALDEANIDRFTKVLRDFLAWTQFIIVTHSKKTMTCADTIYGVTMQESGVSKQVSVRFEDVSEDGHIREERLASSTASSDKEETQAA